MMLKSFPSLNSKIIVNGVFGNKGGTHFWQQRFLPRWLPLFLGLGLGIVIAMMIVGEAWTFLVPVVLIVPAFMLFVRYPFVAVLIWLLVMPYYAVTPTATHRYIYYLLHRAMIPATLGLVILSDWLGVRKRPKVRFGWAELAMAVFLGVALTSIFLFSLRDNKQMVYHFYDRLFVPFCMYWLVRLIAPNEKDLKRFLWVAFITLVAQSVIGILSWFAPELLPPHWLALEGIRTVGSLANVAVYTTTLLFLALLLFQQAMTSKSVALRLVLLAAFGLAYFAVFLSFSRGGWLGGVVVLVGLLFMYPRTIILLTIILIAIVYMLSTSVLEEQIEWAWERFNTEETAEGRVVQYNASVEMVKTKPLLGWGYGNYDRYDFRFLRRVGNIAVRYDGTSHNTFLTILAELGLVGFFYYIFPLVWWFWLTVKIWRRFPRHGFFSLSLLIMLWLLMLDQIIVRNFMDMIRFFPFGTTIWWLTMALIADLIYQFNESEAVESQTGRSRQSLEPNLIAAFDQKLERV